MKTNRKAQDINVAVEIAVEYHNKLVSLYKLKRGRRAIIKAKRWGSILQQIEDQRVFLTTIQLYRDEMIKELGDSISAIPKDEEPPKIQKNTLNDQRAEALKTFVETSEKQTLKSSEAKIVLESIENRKLSRCAVLRSLKKLPEILYGVCDKIGGRSEVRFIMKKSNIRNTSDYSRLIQLGT